MAKPSCDIKKYLRGQLFLPPYKEIYLWYFQINILLNIKIRYTYKILSFVPKLGNRGRLFIKFMGAMIKEVFSDSKNYPLRIYCPEIQELKKFSLGYSFEI